MTDAALAASASSPVSSASSSKLGDRVSADAEVVLDELHHVFAAGQHRIEPESAQRAELVERFEIERIADGDRHAPVVAAQRHQGVAKDGGGGEPRQELAVDLVVVQVDKLHPELVGEGAERFLLAHEAELDHRPIEAVTPRALARGLQLLAADQSPPQQDVTNFHFRYIRIAERRRRGITGNAARTVRSAAAHAMGCRTFARPGTWRRLRCLVSILC